MWPKHNLPAYNEVAFLKIITDFVQKKVLASEIEINLNNWIELTYYLMIAKYDCLYKFLVR
jgi:hypothetical protein